MNEDVKITIKLEGFQGGRFFRNRYVYEIIVKAEELPCWFDTRLSHETFDRLLRIKDSLTTDYLFGKTPRQFFNRVFKWQELWAVDRGGRGGKWWGKAKDMPLIRIPRSRIWHPCGRITDDRLFLYEDILKHEKPDYSILDLGPDRLPSVWVCNLCNRTAEWKDWPHSYVPGLAASDYISECPQCHGKQGDMFDRLAEALEKKENSFRPYQKMQDDYLFTI